MSRLQRQALVIVAADAPLMLEWQLYWGVAKRKGSGLWSRYSKVRILPPQPRLPSAAGRDGLQLCGRSLWRDG